MATDPQVRALAARIRKLERQALQRKQPQLAFSSIDGDLAINDPLGNPIGSIGSSGVSAPGIAHQASVDAIEAEVQATIDLVNSGQSETSQRIDEAVADYLAKYGTVDAKIDDAVADFTAGLATKSKHTLSPNAPGATANNVGDVWEQHKVADATKIVARYRGQGGTSWLPMNLDATYIPLLDIGSGTFGDLSGSRIAARSIGVEKLVVTDWTNLLPEVDQWDGAQFQAGWGHFITITGNGSSPTHFGPKGGAPGWAVKPGDELHFEWDVYTNHAGYTGSLVAYFRTFGRDKTTLVEPQAIAASTVAQGQAIATNPTYQTFSGDLTIPEGCYWLQFLPYVSATMRANISRFELRKKYGGSLIVDGDIYGRHLAAKSIGVDKLLVADLQDYVKDPDFEGLGTWSNIGNVTATGMQYASYTPRPGDRVGQFLEFRCQYIAEGGSAAPVEEPFPVTPGDRYHCSMVYRRAGGSSASGLLGMRFYYYDKNMQIIPSIGYYAQAQVALSTLTTTWGELELNVTVPDGVAFARVYPLVYSTTQAGAGIYNVDRVSCRRKYGGELIVDGSILARHVTADMVEGLLVTGHVLQTSAQAQRGIKISTAGLVGYNASGVPTTVIDPNTGRISAVGAFATASGYDDIEIVPGDASLPAAINFYPNAPFIDTTSPARVHCFDSSDATWDLVNVRLQGSKFTNSGTTPRIDIGTWRRKSNGAVSAHVDLHAGGGATAGTINFYIDGVIEAKADVGGFTLPSGKAIGLGYAAASAPAGGILASGKIKTTGAVEVDNGLYDFGGLYNLGYSGKAAVWNSSGRVAIAGSSRRYKHDIEPMSLDLARRALDLEAVTFRYNEDRDFGDGLWPGVIAEQAEEVGLDLWVGYDNEGLANSFKYAELPVAHNVLIRDLYDRIEQLEASRA